MTEAKMDETERMFKQTGNWLESFYAGFSYEKREE
jgi:hypothetical protein